MFRGRKVPTVLLAVILQGPLQSLAGPETAPSRAAPTPSENAQVEFSPADIASSPDWPCVQRKVTTVSAAQVWDGPSIDGLSDFDPEIRDLTAVLQSRRVPIAEAEKAIKQFAASQPEAERDRRLTLLFASVHASMNTDRSFVVGQIEEFQRRQKARALELQREGQKLADKNLPATGDLLPTETQLSPEQQEYNWNARVFQERQQNLTLACEVPVLIEQRLYEIARLIRAEMNG
jgi:hypothetical protein